MSPEPPPRDALYNLCLADGLWVERYEGWTELGRGGSAHVVRTFSHTTGEDVALKVFHHLTVDDVRRFQQEVRSAQRLTAPSIVRTYSAFPRGSLAWIEMELVEGPDLRTELERRVRDGRPFSVAEGLAIGEALASALATAHEAGIVHRDVKPGNVLLPAAPPPVAKLGDFGICRILGATRVTATGLLAGTPQFAAPEVAAGEEARQASDVYSLSLTLFLVFSGNRFPFPEPGQATAAQWLKTHRESPAWPLRRLSPAAPPGLEALLADGLAKEPRDRPTAREVLTCLGELGGDRTVLLPVRRRARSPALWAVAAVAAAGVGFYAGRQVSDLDPAAVPPTVSSASAPVPPAGPPLPLQVSWLADAVTVSNLGPGAIADLKVTLLGPGTDAYVAVAPGTLASGEEVVLALDAFDPAPPPGFRPRRAEMVAAGGQARGVDLGSAGIK
jgi:eukaryotic-like serine/threonine-protein kinase